ncbi:cAMP-dependent protein kinase catalytic subunit isoform 2, putative [Perkinsus marinus ATCC 50983]|uniref:cAMP-dependent protein kinase catalytic subunit isoform 2, putative n=1 Tax=Perkinsus marinus (strain ATCC 50983 / TXsc) TaxID=423536 RepID=C5L2G0_PERM5|nr:cAMP-dependent protein kinase catalytic subunit isoform 2, putative [Perkinsus marinus ATCC 50983]EER09054.1 cAMP-dependent protein kinase catalytic subunit isoform 2, putative [Perkinsus marinus ATCC 50983]|eukprot:XP_002777238.1 cAMP-dependent protein kinase catalytic subunit isoform 2, putative [Perkinsus marinus ATCC 50983]
MAGVEGPVAMMSLVPTRVVSNSSALQHQRQQQQLGPPAAECCALDSCDVESFELGKTLGTGSFGRVRFATHKASGRHYALKMLKKAVIIRLKQVDHINSEKTILKAIHHPMIVNLYGSFHDSRYLYLALEYVVGGEFFTHLRKVGRFENETARFYAAQIVRIFEYLHSKNIIYRDLKPENILLGADGYLKLTDFGFAKIVHQRTYTLCGTPEYIAPEVLLNKGHGKAVDWWTLGILTYEMMVGCPPFVDEDPMGIYQKILTGKIVFPRSFDKHAKTLVKKMLTADLTQRYGTLRGGVDDIKKCKWFAGISWEALYRKEIESPYKPMVKSATDTSNFEDYPDSTDLAPIVSAIDDPFVSW